MFLERPHLRFDGLYVSRNTYIKRGLVEWCAAEARPHLHVSPVPGLCVTSLSSSRLSQAKAFEVHEPYPVFPTLLDRVSDPLCAVFVRRRVKSACHLVCYYRYVRFLPDGHLLYRTSPEVVSRVARRLVDAPGQQGCRKDDAVHEGRYRCQVRGQPRVESVLCPAPVDRLREPVFMAPSRAQGGSLAGAPPAISV